MDVIKVPESMGGDLRIIPDGAYEAVISDVFMGKSQAGNAKATVKWIIQSEYEKYDQMTKKEKEAFISCVGETVLESFALTENAMWNINGLFKEATDERIPQGDFDIEGFRQILVDGLVGFEATLLMEKGTSTAGNDFMDIKGRQKK